MPGKDSTPPLQSKLIPFQKEILEAWFARKTLKRIQETLQEKHGVTIALSSLSDRLAGKFVLMDTGGGSHRQNQAESGSMRHTSFHSLCKRFVALQPTSAGSSYSYP